MDGFEVLAPGPYTTIQDVGRFGYQRLGIPTSGALDTFALKVGNLLVGNLEGEAGLEVTLTGLKLRAFLDTLIAITGADLGAKIEGEFVPLWTALSIKEGQVLSFDRIKRGCRAYLAIAGGIAVPEVMGSKSTYVKGRLGGMEGRPLKTGDRIPIGAKVIPTYLIGREYPIEKLPKSDGLLRLVIGPQVDFFTDASIKRFFQASYKITPMADRMGIILEGPPLEFTGGPRSIISEGLVPGCLQVTGSGLPILVLVEQTLGGYPKLGAVIAADIWKVGQGKPGDTFLFKEVRLEHAILALQDLEQSLSTFRGI
jgi:antagonist of KipI